jgi:hypothetical protein
LTPIPLSRTLGIILEDRNYQTTKGSIVLNKTATGFSLDVKLNKPLMGLKAGEVLKSALTYKTKLFRDINIQYLVEEGIPLDLDARFMDKNVSLKEVFAKHGINLNINVIANQIRSTDWDLRTDYSALYSAFRRRASVPMDNESWDVCIMHLGASSEHGLNGIMFDDEGRHVTIPKFFLPFRRALAIFAGDIAENYENSPFINPAAKIIQTTAHELGHALNLAHRFERGVGRADSLSCMNYSWKFSRGEPQFWRDFNFTFDDDEISFLLHAPLYKIIFGGLEFHKVNYWIGNGQYVPYYNEVVDQRFQLSLSAPASTYPFGEPVLLEVALSAMQPTIIPSYFLDVKAGALEIAVTQVPTGSAFAEAAPEVTTKFKPLMVKCFDTDRQGAKEVQMVEIKPGTPLKENVNVHFGSGGFAFAQPGTYRISAVLSTAYDRHSVSEFVVTSNPVTIRIEYPHDQEEEEDATVLLHPDVGRFVATGGNAALSDETIKKLESSVLRRNNLVGINRALLLAFNNSPTTPKADSSKLWEAMKLKINRLDDTTAQKTKEYVRNKFQYDM